MSIDNAIFFQGRTKLFCAEDHNLTALGVINEVPEAAQAYSIYYSKKFGRLYRGRSMVSSTWDEGIVHNDYDDSFLYRKSSNEWQLRGDGTDTNGGRPSVPAYGISSGASNSAEGLRVACGTNWTRVCFDGINFTTFGLNENPSDIGPKPSPGRTGKTIFSNGKFYVLQGDRLYWSSNLINWSYRDLGYTSDDEEGFVHSSTTLTKAGLIINYAKIVPRPSNPSGSGITLWKKIFQTFDGSTVMEIPPVYDENADPEDPDYLPNQRNALSSVQMDPFGEIYILNPNNASGSVNFGKVKIKRLIGGVWAPWADVHDGNASNFMSFGSPFGAPPSTSNGEMHVVRRIYSGGVEVNRVLCSTSNCWRSWRERPLPYGVNSRLAVALEDNLIITNTNYVENVDANEIFILRGGEDLISAPLIRYPTGEQIRSSNGVMNQTGMFYYGRIKGPPVRWIEYSEDGKSWVTCPGSVQVGGMTLGDYPYMKFFETRNRLICGFVSSSLYNFSESIGGRYGDIWYHHTYSSDGISFNSTNWQKLTGSAAPNLRHSPPPVASETTDAAIMRLPYSTSYMRSTDGLIWHYDPMTLPQGGTLYPGYWSVGWSRVVEKFIFHDDWGSEWGSSIPGVVGDGKRPRDTIYWSDDGINWAYAGKYDGLTQEGANIYALSTYDFIPEVGISNNGFKASTKVPSAYSRSYAASSTGNALVGISYDSANNEALVAVSTNGETFDRVSVGSDPELLDLASYSAPHNYRVAVTGGDVEGWRIGFV